MALWDKIKSRGDVQDRRSIAPVVGGLGAGGLALYLVFSLLTGGEIDVGQVLSQLESTQISQYEGTQFEGEDEYEVFASTVLGSNNDLWREEFSKINEVYEEPTLVLFRQATQSSCGTATSQVGPHYCSLDRTIYLDETFFEELIIRFGAKGGDVAEAYVIAHEVGHHVQGLLGQLSGENDPIQIELQADCYAGIWANSIEGLGVLEPGEVREAMDAAAAVGDDRIQERVSGQINPETWTHGSSEQRVSAFMTGFETAEIASCDNL